MTSLFHRRITAIHRANPAGHAGLDLFGGLETRTHADGYRWDGLRRGADPTAPFLVFQHTLAGCGHLEIGGRALPVPAGHAFVVTVPSPHAYAVADDATRWKFYWFIVRHPYVVRRLAAKLAAPAAALAAPDHAPLSAAAMEVFRHATAGTAAAPAELALFRWMLEVEGALAARGAPPGEADRLLEEVRSQVLARPQHPPDVPELAARGRMDRSAYTRMFRRVTGRTPASWITEIRIGEVARRLRHSGDKLDAIARATGFADANHLCKVFRRRTGLSPGAFRKQGL